MLKTLFTHQPEEQEQPFGTPPESPCTHEGLATGIVQGPPAMADDHPEEHEHVFGVIQFPFWQSGLQVAVSQWVPDQPDWQLHSPGLLQVPCWQPTRGTQLSQRAPDQPKYDEWKTEIF